MYCSVCLFLVWVVSVCQASCVTALQHVSHNNSHISCISVNKEGPCSYIISLLYHTTDQLTPAVQTYLISYLRVFYSQMGKHDLIFDLLYVCHMLEEHMNELWAETQVWRVKGENRPDSYKPGGAVEQNVFIGRLYFSGSDCFHPRPPVVGDLGSWISLLCL